MLYKHTSIKEIIGMLIRNTRLQDSSYIADAHEWIFEAAEQLKTEFSMKGCWKKLTVSYHKAKLPCELDFLDAVEYKGTRLHENKAVRHPSQHQYLGYSDPDTYTTSIETIENAEDRFNYVTRLTQVNQLAINSEQYYYAEMGYLTTSFADGEVTIYYQAVPTDDDGMPLIPDTQNYKNALYWYCRAMMIGSGWKDEQFSFEYCMQQFEKVYGPRALAEIRLPTPEQMERRVQKLTRFIPDAGYYDSFFYTDRPEGYYQTI